MEQQYTIERFNKFLEDQGGMHNEPEDVNELILEGAKDYYCNVRYNTNDYVSKQDIEDSMDDAFDQFAQQSSVIDYIENFAKSEGIEVEAVFFAIEQRKEEIKGFLFIDEIAQAANEGMDD